MPKKHRFKDLSKMPVQEQPCYTCPFEGEKPIQLDPNSLARYITAIVNFESQHFCHSANNRKLCRGGRSLLLRALCTKNLISEPTDEAFEKARKEVLGF